MEPGPGLVGMACQPSYLGGRRVHVQGLSNSERPRVSKHIEKSARGWLRKRTLGRLGLSRSWVPSQDIYSTEGEKRKEEKE